MTSKLFAPGTVIDSPWLNDVDTSTYNLLTAVAGTNTITATGPVSLTSIVAGDRFFFSPAASNTGAVTINISGLGANPITKFGPNNLAAGDLSAGSVALIVYDGSLFQLINPLLPGRLINVQTFLASGTYTPSGGVRSVIVDCYGAGGGGGTAGNPGVGSKALGTPGGSGGWSRSRLTSGFSGAAVVIGAGGAAGGGAGGSTTFGGGLVVALGGGSGQTSVGFPMASEIYLASGQGAGAGTGNIIASPGNAAVPAMCAPGQTPWGAPGGIGFLGGSLGLTGSNSNGNSATPNSGAGGGGAASIGATSDWLGGAGGSGRVVIYEYS